MSDWLDDLYESPGGDELSLMARKQEIIQLVISEFDAMGKGKVRLRWVIENRLNIDGHIYSSDLLDIFYSMVETGNYDGRLMKYQGFSDILIWRKPWHERNRLMFGFINSSIGYAAVVIVTFIIGLLFGKSCNQ